MHTREEIELFQKARMKLPLKEQLKISKLLSEHPELLPKMIDNFTEKYNAMKNGDVGELDKIIDKEYDEMEGMLREAIKEE